VELLERASWLEGIYKLPPDPSSDDETQDSNVQRNDSEQQDAPQTPHQTQRPGTLSQIVDLGTPSGSERSDDRDAHHSNIPTTPPSIGPQLKFDGVMIVRGLSSGPVVVDTIEEVIPVTIEPTPIVVRPRPPLGEASEHASIASVSRWAWSQIEETQNAL
jgi:hypothetical protein